MSGEITGAFPDAIEALPRPGALVDIHSVRHRLLAYIRKRALLTALSDHHPWLVQDRDGSLQLPTKRYILEMLRCGAARAVADEDISPTEKLKVEIELLDANNIRQGDKSIWIFLAKAWTPELEARFGPHDDPWRIRRWRAALRDASDRERPHA